jgi:hypothetical protein
MADSKITALDNLTAADPVNDMFPIVDVNDTTMAASGTTKRISVNNLLSSSPTASGALTVTGLVTAGSATITGAATVGTTLTVSGAGPHSFGGQINTIGSTAGFQMQPRDGSGANWLLYNPTGDNLKIYNNIGSDVVSISNAGDVSVVTGNVVMATSGKGIDFSAVTGGTGTATGNVLNDYEEGTFTPTLQFSGLSVGVTYSTRTGIYTKVGRIVHFSGRIDLSSKGTSVGDATISGLPFAANTGAASVGYQSSIAPSDKQAILTIDTSSLIVRYASGTTTAASTDTNFSNSSILIFAGTYAV